MTGGILQLVARGYDDAYIILSPDITFFKIVYRRHTNFSMYPTILKFNEVPAFGRLCKCQIRNLGDLVTKLVIEVELPEIDLGNEYFRNSDIITILEKYDIILNVNPNSIISFAIYNEIREVVLAKINSLLNDLNNEPSMKLKAVINSKLSKIGFKNSSGWSFPDKTTFLDEKFVHNELTDQLLSILKTGKPQFAWKQYLMHTLIEYMEIVIDGIVIDKHDSNTIHNEFLINRENDKHRQLEFIGYNTDLNLYNSETKLKKILHIPLNFWFSKRFSSALPLTALNYNDIFVNVKFRDFDDVCVYNGFKFSQIPKLKSHIYANFIYVESDERQRLAKTKMQYLIETYQIAQEDVFDKDDIDDEMRFEYKLHFNFSVKQIFWMVMPFKKNKFNDFDYTFINKSKKVFEPIDSVIIKFCGRDRETQQPFGVYKYVNQYQHFCSSLESNMYLYNFALYPQELQPSGSANFGKLSDNSIDMFVNKDLYDMIQDNERFRVVSGALSVNMLNIVSGMGGLLFT